MDQWQRIIGELDNNSFVIYADASGARIVAKLRGATADEMGAMLGAAQASLERQIDMLRDHVRTKGGEPAVAAFDVGIIVGLKRQPSHEGLKVYDKKPTKENE